MNVPDRRGQELPIRDDEPGTFPYACEIHPFMTATLTVLE